CAGLTDYTISLENGYRIDRLSAHQIAIYGEEPVKSHEENIINYLYVPSKVTAVWWNDQYIIAKQMHLSANERGYDEPPQNPTAEDYSYWIIEMQKHEVNGPISQKQLESEINSLIGENIIFIPIEQLERES
ncbi:hypothetical protein RhiirA1_404616, partial [Rhizophagus irregularis]